MAALFDTFVAYKFIKLLATPFDKTDAYKLGIIDAEGKVLRPRKSLINSKDKAAYPSNINTLVWNLKKVLMKVPIVKSRIGQFASALWLLKEETGCNYDVLLEIFSEHTGINKQDLVLTEQGKVYAMVDKKIILESHIEESLIEGVDISRWDFLDVEIRTAIAECVYTNKSTARKIATKNRCQIDDRTFGKMSSLFEARYGDAELSWDDMPEDERFDVADIAFDASKAKKISKTEWKKVSSSDKKKLIKTMEDETDGLVTIAEAKGKESAKDHWRRISNKGVVGVPIDRDRFPNREKEGLEGPYRSKKSGLIYYYDKKEGKYYDPQSDMYLQVSDVMEARLTSKKVAPKRNKNRPAGMLGVRADSPDWKSATIAIPVKTFDGDGAETIFRKGDMIDYHKFDSQRVVGAKDRTDPMTYFYLAKTRITESVDLEEGKMKELHMHIEDGKTAEEIAKIMKIDVKAIKALMKDFEESVNEAMIGVSGYRLVSLPAAYRFSFGGDAEKFVEGIKTNYSRDVVVATIDKGGRLVHVEYTDPKKSIEKEVRRRVEKTARHYKAQIVAEERATWDLDELGFQPEKKSESLAEAWSAETIDDAAKSKYGITITPKMMRAAKKEYWHMTTTKDRGDRYRVQLQIKGGDPTNISGTADEVAAKVNDELNLKEAVNEAITDDRKDIAKALKTWAKPYVTGTISVKSGKGKFPYVQLTARDGEIDNKLRKMVMDKAFPKAKNVGNMDDISYGNVTKSYIAVGAGDWARVMGLEEDMPATNTSGVAGTGNDPVVGVPTSKKKKKKAIARTEPMTEMNNLPKKHKLVDEYRGVKVFRISAEEFEGATARRKYQRWNESDAFVAVKRYSLKNPGKPVIIQNEETGEMSLVRRKMDDGRLKHNRR